MEDSSEQSSNAAVTTNKILPEKIVDMTLPQLRHDYHERLFQGYLPFWEKGGFDRENGGVMCELNDDGSVAVDMKYIWYQGRAVWVYSYLYNNFGRDPAFWDSSPLRK